MGPLVPISRGKARVRTIWRTSRSRISHPRFPYFYAVHLVTMSAEGSRLWLKPNQRNCYQLLRVVLGIQNSRAVNCDCTKRGTWVMLAVLALTGWKTPLLRPSSHWMQEPIVISACSLLVRLAPNFPLVSSRSVISSWPNLRLASGHLYLDSSQVFQVIDSATVFRIGFTWFLAGSIRSSRSAFVSCLTVGVSNMSSLRLMQLMHLMLLIH